MCHSIFYKKLKINGTKIDNTIIQSIKLFDELDKEINAYSMRLREWYSWHFPELSNLISDNIIFAKIVSKIETREKLPFLDLKDLLPPNLEKEIIGYRYTLHEVQGYYVDTNHRPEQTQKFLEIYFNSFK